ncbi:DUF397 domain-containing protein [Streptomyces adustus]|uniref:DUF397 domain-containing protein n=1 Tax=Streptomyces adustus TaxID=1609272 RepID=UPI0037200657
MSPESAWFKSSYSSSGGGECLEVAPSPHTVHVRDSKLGAHGPWVDVPVDAWIPFVAYVAARPV